MADGFFLIRRREPKGAAVLIRTDAVTVYNDKPPWRGAIHSTPDGRVVLNGRPLSDRDARRGWALASEYSEEGR